MRLLTALTNRLAPLEVQAHCDLPCGVYDPAQARIEAESVKAICELHGLFNEATKLAGAGGTKASLDPAKAQELLDKIAAIDKIFWETKQA
jgi:nickel superoxide dismutase